MTTTFLRQATAVATVLAAAAVVAPASAAHQAASCDHRGPPAARVAHRPRRRGPRLTCARRVEDRHVDAGQQGRARRDGHACGVAQQGQRPATSCGSPSQRRRSSPTRSRRCPRPGWCRRRGPTCSPASTGAGCRTSRRWSAPARPRTWCSRVCAGAADAYNLGCVYGSEGPRGRLQTWSLSHSCFNPVGGAASAGSTLAAAWPARTPSPTGSAPPRRSQRQETTRLSRWRAPATCIGWG